MSFPYRQNKRNIAAADMLHGSNPLVKTGVLASGTPKSQLHVAERGLVPSGSNETWLRDTSSASYSTLHVSRLKMSLILNGCPHF